jgi:hypothetical protein
MTELSPNPQIQRFVLSSAAHFVGTYEDAGIRIAHAFPDLTTSTRPFQPRPVPSRRMHAICTFRTEPEPRAGTFAVVPTYSWVADRVTSLLSVLLGKHFEFHGFLDREGVHYFPAKGVFRLNYACGTLPFNDQIWPDLEIPLDLQRFGAVRPALVTDGEDADAFYSAARFFRDALEHYDVLPETAYLHLVTAGEIISQVMGFQKESLYDDDLRALLKTIEDGCDASVANKVAGRLFQVRRSYLETMKTLVDARFFGGKIATGPATGFIEGEPFDRTVKAAYDLRSKYVHVGARIAPCLRSFEMHNAEIISAYTLGMGDDLRKTLQRAPTLLGLVRLTRFILFRFLETRLLLNAAVPVAAYSPDPLLEVARGRLTDVDRAAGNDV